MTQSVPHQDDFRVSLGDEIEAEIRREIEATVSSRSSEAQADLWQRLLTTVRHFATTMAEARAPGPPHRPAERALGPCGGAVRVSRVQ